MPTRQSGLTHEVGPYAVPCETCKSPPGRMCVTGWDRHNTAPHAPRVAQSQAKYALEKAMKHTPDNPNACPVCSPIRCEVARRREQRPAPAGSMTPKQYAMLVEANGVSLPGDGLRIKGPGQHRIARSLEWMGLVRVATFGEGIKARVHVTTAGRALRERIAAELSAMSE